MTDGLPPLNTGPRRGTTLDELLDGPEDDLPPAALRTSGPELSDPELADLELSDPGPRRSGWPGDGLFGSASDGSRRGGSALGDGMADSADRGGALGARVAAGDDELSDGARGGDHWSGRPLDAPGPRLSNGVGRAARVADFGRSHLLAVAAVLLVVLLASAGFMMRAHSATLPVTATGLGSPAADTDGTAVVGLPTASGVSSGAATPGSGGGQVGATAATSGLALPTRLEVHVWGAVRHPGVVRVAPGARVQDVLTAAGGLAPTAALAELNLAAPVLDGDQVLIGTRAHPRGEVRHAGQGGDNGGSSSQDGSATSSGDEATTGTATAGAGSGSGASTTVNLNTATAAQLDALPGVGPVTAQKILDWRSVHHRFSSVKELQEVDGIGEKTYARLAPHVTT